MERVAAQLIMIIEILVAKDQSVNSLADQALDTVFHVALVAQIDKTF